MSTGPMALRAPFLRAPHAQFTMTHSLPLPSPGFDELPADEKLAYLQSPWDRMAAHPDRAPVPEWQRALIEERFKEHRAHPDDVAPWDEVRESVTWIHGTVDGAAQANPWVARDSNVNPCENVVRAVEARRGLAPSSGTEH